MNLDLDVYEILQPIIGLNSPACPNLGYETSPEMTSTTRGVLMKVHSLKADLRPMEGHCLDFRDTQSPVDTKSSTRDEESILQMIHPGSCQSLYTPALKMNPGFCLGSILDHGGWILQFTQTKVSSHFTAKRPTIMVFCYLMIFMFFSRYLEGRYEHAR